MPDVILAEGNVFTRVGCRPIVLYCIWHIITIDTWFCVVLFNAIYSLPPLDRLIIVMVKRNVLP